MNTDWMLNTKYAEIYVFYNSKHIDERNASQGLLLQTSVNEGKQKNVDTKWEVRTSRTTRGRGPWWGWLATPVIRIVTTVAQVTTTSTWI